MDQEPQVCFRCPTDFRDRFVGRARGRGSKAQIILKTFAERWLKAAESIPDTEQMRACPYCGSMAYDGSARPANALVRDSVPKTEQKLQAALHLRGVQKRKAIHELIEYKCAEALPGVYLIAKRWTPSAAATPATPSAPPHIKVYLTIDPDLTSLMTSADTPPTQQRKAGWVLASEVITGTKKQVAARFQIQ